MNTTFPRLNPGHTGLLALTLAFVATEAGAQSLSLDFGDGPTSTGRVVQLFVLLGVLSLAPSILVMVTSFTRIVVVLSFLRNAIGLQQSHGCNTDRCTYICIYIYV